MKFAKFAAFALVFAMFLLPFGCLAQRGQAKPGPVEGCGKYPASETAVKFLPSGAMACAEVADTPMQRERGLMYRKSLGDDEGMLFVFDRAQPLRFWMHNTQIPLMIVFFDENRKVVDIKKMYPCDTGSRLPCPIYESKLPAKYAIELSPNFFLRNEIKEGEYASWN